MEHAGRGWRRCRDDIPLAACHGVELYRGIGRSGKRSRGRGSIRSGAARARRRTAIAEWFAPRGPSGVRDDFTDRGIAFLFLTALASVGICGHYI